MEGAVGDVQGVPDGRVRLLRQHDAGHAQLHHGGDSDLPVQPGLHDGRVQHAGGSEGGSGDQDTQWQTEVFRSSIIRKLDEAVRKLVSPTEINAADLERQVFQRTDSKEEYLSFVARLILYVRQQADGQDAENVAFSQEEADSGGAG